MKGLLKDICTFVFGKDACLLCYQQDLVKLLVMLVFCLLLLTGCVTSLQLTSFQTTIDVIEDVTEGESNILTCFITFHGIV